MGFARWLFRAMIRDTAAHVKRYGATDLAIAFWCAGATVGAWRIGWWIAFVYAVLGAQTAYYLGRTVERDRIEARDERRREIAREMEADDAHP